MSNQNKRSWDKEEADLIAEAGGVKLREVRGPSAEQVEASIKASAKREAEKANRNAFIAKCVEAGIGERQAFDAAFFRAEAVRVDPYQAAADYIKAFNQ